MKITLDFSDNVRGAFVNYVRKGISGTYDMVSYGLDSEDLHDGNVIKIPREDKQNDGN